MSNTSERPKRASDQVICISFVRKNSYTLVTMKLRKLPMHYQTEVDQTKNLLCRKCMINLHNTKLLKKF